ncbi:hypothetical protein PaMx11_24 [Pseudomonas phage PaMx11]|uniref:Uncharacterized protein n=1 Tax=Pseudomonas phage PaMx11 TaxID=1175657 RepID=A0A0S0N7X0_BPPAM|nr:hypothetical protein AVV52_gp24 [Pseudomonas phage PaMx11]ALH23698.1 hypothetical protein PaMx11_24 [Pseudomonas phage PaMx11]
MPKGSKQTLRASLQQVWKTLGRKPKQLAEAPEMPEELAYVWEWYREVFSGQPLTFSELHHWSVMTGKRLLGWEAELIKSIDRIFWKVQHDGHRSATTKN